MKNKILALVASFLLMVGTPLALAADDLQVPSDVENLMAYPGDSEVSLEWDMATDNVGVTEYKIYYGLETVDNDGGEYIFGPVSTGSDDLSYTVDSLENDVTYYFVITAVDEAGNESDYYSNEASATPTSGDTADTDAPYILSTTATSNMMVEVVFSEEIELPTDATDAFDIVNLDTDEALDVVDAYLSDEDETTVLVLTDLQEEGMSYQLTVSSSVMDKAGNAVVSGTTDTAFFDGGAETTSVADEEEEEVEEETTEEEDVESPEVNSVEATELTEIVVTFDEEIVLPEEMPESVFEITLAEDGTVLEIASATQDEEDGAIVALEVAEMAPGEQYIMVVTGVTDRSGNELTNTFDRTASFDAPVADITDIIAPEDVTNFLGATSSEVEGEVELTWDASENSEGDLAEQRLYVDDAAEYESLGAEVISHIVSGLTAGQTYTFKLTTVDETGNESEGMFATVTLPETGAGLGAVLLATALGTGYVTRRRKN